MGGEEALTESDAERNCLHCLIGAAIVRRIGPDASRWQEADVQAIIHEIVQALGELIVIITAQGDRDALLAEFQRVLRETVRHEGALVARQRSLH